MLYEENIDKSLEQFGIQKINLPLEFKQRLHQALHQICENPKIDKKNQKIYYIIGGHFYMYDGKSNILGRNDGKNDWELEMGKDIIGPNGENIRFFQNLLK